MLVFGLAAWIFVLTATPRYTVNTQLFVSTPGARAADLVSLAQGGAFAQQRAASYAQLLDGAEVADAVLDDLDVDLTQTELRDRIDVQVLPQTVILDAQVTDESPQQAVAIARSLGEQFSRLVVLLETQPESDAPPVRVTVVAQPRAPDEPTSPQTAPILGLALGVGLLLGAIAAVIRDRLDTTVRDDRVAAETLGAPVLALVPTVDADRERTRRAELPPPAVEAYRGLVTTLLAATPQGDPRVVLVTSAHFGEGRTTTAIRLAQALAEGDSRVLLVDADTRNPSAARRLGWAQEPGLTEVLTGATSLEAAIRSADGRLSVLPAGGRPANPSEALSSAAMAELLHRAASTFDVVLVDAPPLLPVADARGLAPLTTGAVVCVRWGRTRREQLERSRSMLEMTGTRILGTVLTFVPRRVAEHLGLAEPGRRETAGPEPAERRSDDAVSAGSPEG
jgi:non-specific protein-tyrosine kinase